MNQKTLVTAAQPKPAKQSRVPIADDDHELFIEFRRLIGDVIAASPDDELACRLCAIRAAYLMPLDARLKATGGEQNRATSVLVLRERHAAIWMAAARAELISEHGRLIDRPRPPPPGTNRRTAIGAEILP